MVIIPLMVTILFLLTLLVADMGRVSYLSQKAQAVSDAALLSSLRLRVEALEGIAERWWSFGNLFYGGTNQGAVSSNESWNELFQKSDQLKRALPGYKGRIKAVIKVVEEANQVPAHKVQLWDDSALDLGISAQDQWISLENGARKLLSGAWYKRNWAPSDSWGEPKEKSHIAVSWLMPLLGFQFLSFQNWMVHKESWGRVRWDVDLNDRLIQLQGNGGFPRTWPEALNGGKVDPFRIPTFSAQLDNTQK